MERENIGLTSPEAKVARHAGRMAAIQAYPIPQRVIPPRGCSQVSLELRGEIPHPLNGLHDGGGFLALILLQVLDDAKYGDF